MKIPQTMNRYCPYCDSHTEHRVSNHTWKGLNKSHPQSHGSKSRTRKRGQRRGFGNHGRFSRPPIGAWKMTGSKTSKKTDLRYTCTECNKTHIQKKGVRARRIEVTNV